MAVKIAIMIRTQTIHSTLGRHGGTSGIKGKSKYIMKFPRPIYNYNTPDSSLLETHRLAPFPHMKDDIPITDM